MTCYWVGHLKMRPIDVDKFSKRKALINEFDSRINANEPTKEPVLAENIMEEASSNPDRLD